MPGVEQLGPERLAQIEVVSMDLSAAYQKAVSEALPGAEIETGLTNARLEGMNNQIRLLSHRAYGFHSAQALIATVYLCCSDLQIDLPLPLL